MGKRSEYSTVSQFQTTTTHVNELKKITFLNAPNIPTDKKKDSPRNISIIMLIKVSKLA